MVARVWGLYSQRLDKKRLLHQCNLPREIKAATGSGGVRARDLGKTTLTWRGPARQRNAQSGGGVWLSAAVWVRSRVREGEDGPGGLAGPALMLGQIGGAWPFSFVYSFSFSVLIF